MQIFKKVKKHICVCKKFCWENTATDSLFFCFKILLGNGKDGNM